MSIIGDIFAAGVIGFLYTLGFIILTSKEDFLNRKHWNKNLRKISYFIGNVLLLSSITFLALLILWRI